MVMRKSCEASTVGMSFGALSNNAYTAGHHKDP